MRLGLSALVLSAFILPAAAHADTFHFTISSNGDAYTFSVDPAATPLSVDGDGTTFAANVTETYMSVAAHVSDFVEFFNPTGLNFSEVFFSTPSIFDGSTFVTTPPGSPLEADFFGDPGSPYELTITSSPSVATTPEPSSLALLGTGALGLVGVVRRRFVS